VRATVQTEAKDQASLVVQQPQDDRYTGDTMTTLPTNTLILVAVLIAVATGVVAWFVIQRQKSVLLKRRFGAEYDRTVNELGGRAKAEAELTKRQQRVAGLKITPLTPADAATFSQGWNTLQGRFVDNPKGAVTEADLLVRELMAKRGYPVGDFELAAADISVDYPGIVSTYRVAQAIAVRNARGEADTEELRKAVVHYRTLFDELLGVSPTKASAAPAVLVGGVPVHS
jgi:hypothetical protein